MSTAIFDGTKTLVSVTKLFAELVGDGNIHFSGEGIRISSMDASHVCLMRTMLFPDCMVRYECDEAVTVGVNFRSLHKILNSFANDSRVTLQIDDEHQDVIKIELGNDDGVHKFAMKLMEIDEDDLSIPEMSYPFEMDVPYDKFKKCIDQAESLEAHTISFKYNGDKKLLMSYETDIVSADLVIHSDESYSSTEETRTSIASKYPRRLFASKPLADNVFVGMGYDLPVQFRYYINKTTSFVELFVAPKIDDVDDDDEYSNVRE